MNKTEQIDYVAYIDTDSLFLLIGKFLDQQGIQRDLWEKLPQSTRTKYIIKISKIIEGDVNNRAYYETQLQDYNSILDIDDFRIEFKQEICCPKALFLAPKMYVYHVVDEEGFTCDKIDAKGIEIVRSNSPTVFRGALKHLVERLLKGDDDSLLSEIVESNRIKFYNAKPEDISTNIGANNLTKWINKDNSYILGTPYHIKGIANYHWLLDEFGISKKYERIKEGDKVKVCYIKDNRYGVKIVSYYDYPKEFIDNGVFVDYEKMIDKFFVKKASIILDPINRGKIIQGRSVEDDFF